MLSVVLVLGGAGDGDKNRPTHLRRRESAAVRWIVAGENYANGDCVWEGVYQVIVTVPKKKISFTWRHILQ